MGIWFDYTWILKKRQWSNKRKLWKSGRKLTKSGLLSSDPFCQYFWWFLSIFVLILVLLVLVLFVLISVLLVWVGLPMPVVFSGVQETVIQSRRVGVTKIASRWGRGASLLPYIGGAASDIEPAKYWWDIMWRGSLPYTLGGSLRSEEFHTSVHVAHFMVHLSKITRMLLWKLLCVTSSTAQKMIHQ